uniref:Uncharacterized protein n=1 Tax=Oryza sativa subsp. japonica TaxID=39947 RepID=Q69LL2_ORYSJ|nr:unknown protein [Oryza sativa Japonica Group]BAD31763.1 unknown protein [Oryza sativa Japonica Group]
MTVHMKNGDQRPHEWFGRTGGSAEPWTAPFSPFFLADTNFEALSPLAWRSSGLLQPVVQNPRAPLRTSAWFGEPLVGRARGCRAEDEHRLRWRWGCCGGRSSCSGALAPLSSPPPRRPSPTAGLSPPPPAGLLSLPLAGGERSVDTICDGAWPCLHLRGHHCGARPRLRLPPNTGGDTALLTPFTTARHPRLVPRRSRRRLLLSCLALASSSPAAGRLGQRREEKTDHPISGEVAILWYTSGQSKTIRIAVPAVMGGLSNVFLEDKLRRRRRLAYTPVELPVGVELKPSLDR